MTSAIDSWYQKSHSFDLKSQRGLLNFFSSLHLDDWCSFLEDLFLGRNLAYINLILLPAIDSDPLTECELCLGMLGIPSKILILDVLDILIQKYPVEQNYQGVLIAEQVLNLVGSLGSGLDLRFVKSIILNDKHTEKVRYAAAMTLINATSQLANSSLHDYVNFFMALDPKKLNFLIPLRVLALSNYGEAEQALRSLVYAEDRQEKLVHINDIIHVALEQLLKQQDALEVLAKILQDVPSFIRVIMIKVLKGNYFAKNKIIEQLEAIKHSPYVDMTDKTEAGSCWTTIDGQFVSGNDVFVGVLGYTSFEDLRESVRNVSQLYLDPAKRSEMIAHLQRGESILNYDLQFRHPIKEKIWVRVNARRVFEKGRPLLACTVKDITEQKSKQHELENFRELFDKAVIGIFRSTEAGKYVAVNPALAKMYKYDSPEHLIAEITDIKNQLYVDPDRRKDFIAEIKNSGQVNHFEYEVWCNRKSTKIWIVEDARIITTVDGETLYEGTVSDITDKKRAEQKTKALYENLKIPLLEFNSDGTKFYGNAAFAYMFGYSSIKEMQADLDSLKNLFVDNQEWKNLIKIVDRYGKIDEFRTTLKSRGGEIEVMIDISVSADRDNETNQQNYSGTIKQLNPVHIAENIKQSMPETQDVSNADQEVQNPISAFKVAKRLEHIAVGLGLTGPYGP